MAKTARQKLKMLYLNKFFLENTDENHMATINEIIEFLASVGISAERKSLYDDFEQLRLFGTDVLSIKQGGTTSYYVADRTFEVSELKLLVDAVRVAKFITDKKSNQLISKLETLCSRHEAQALSRQVIMPDRIKAMNESIYYNVDKIHSAINDNLSINFKYFEFNADKQRVLRHDGKTYHVSPFALNWDDENYYLIAYDEDAEMIRHYRVDKMTEIKITEKARRGKKAFDEIDLSMYSKKVFSMFGGKDTQVCLEFDEKLCGVIIDRFGKDVMMRRSEHDGRIYAYCNVVVSPHFYGWLFSFDGRIKIATPESVADGFIEYTKKVMKEYE